MTYSLSRTKPTVALFGIGPNPINGNRDEREEAMAEALVPVKKRFGKRVKFLRVDVADDDEGQDLCDRTEAPCQSVAVFAPGGASVSWWTGSWAADRVAERLTSLLAAPPDEAAAVPAPESRKK